MQSPQDHNPISPEIAERMQFLLSRQLDGDLASEEALELARIGNTELVNRYVGRIHQIRERLKSLPVKPVPGSFAVSVRQAILDDSAKSQTSVLDGANRSWAQRLIVSATIAACALGLVIILRPSGVNDSYRVASKMNPASANLESMGISDSVPADSVASMDSVMKAGPPVAADHPEHEELRPFLESDDWRIVVVQVNSRDRDDVMRDIEAIVAQNDMNIQPIVDHDDERHDNRFGVLLTSARVNEEDFINSVVPQADAKSADWNAQNVAESSRESLISRLQESLKTPTYSELHFGQVYVTLPKRSETVDVADQKLVARSAIPEGKASSQPGEKKLAASSENASATTLPAPRKPVLVVFEFTDPFNDHI